ncbi:putative WRKY transcription factor 23 [Gossypium australe]|uniref:WRKY transcription factor n=1 Tax=Gossypium australe TaxID=47621 RepID=A0A5B6U0N9_9ROSI|nr:putative WRKY transcription factor 23 [Gossypium australe]
MERKEGVKVEDVLGNSSCSVNDFPLQSIFDSSSNEEEKIRSLGFMDLLGVQDLISSPLLEIMAAQQVPSLTTTQPPNPFSSTKIESPHEVFNQPATPNSSTISSASSGAVHDEPAKLDDQEEDQRKTKKQLKPKKTNQKRQREPRFAFMTKSEVDHLEDGYRWRKYGQKAVKNSPFPRSYYRCTTISCNVKKRVERCFSDPSIVVTTYEGQHTHPSPVMPRPNLVGSHLNSAISASSFGMPMQTTPSHYHQHFQQPFTDNLSPLNFGHNGSLNATFLHQKRFCTPGPGPGPSLLKDHGLLQDILPSHMLKEE